MKITRTYAAPDGVSGMEEIDVEFETSEFVPGHTPLGVSPAAPAQHVKILQLPGDWESGWHPSPVRQYMVLLAGGWKMETGDGQIKEFQPGDVALLEDTTGRGHHTTILQDSLFVAIALE